MANKSKRKKAKNKNKKGTTILMRCTSKIHKFKTKIKTLDIFLNGVGLNKIRRTDRKKKKSF